MDQRIFDQLDRLERGARVGTRALQYAYDDSSMEYSAYEGPGATYEREEPYPHEFAGGNGGFADRVNFDDYYGDGFAEQPHYGYGEGRATHGAPVHPPSMAIDSYTYGSRTGHISEHRSPVNPPSFTAQGFDLSRSALDQNRPDESSSSPFHQAQHSSPAFNASQRHPEPYELPNSSQPSLRRSGLAEVNRRTAYEPLGIEDLRAEGQDMYDAVQSVQAEDFRSSYHQLTQAPRRKSNGPTTPVVQGISLVSTRTLPDRFRAVFPYPLFNAIQSKSFETIYNSNNNFVLSAPTGSGKTAVLELAICRLVTGLASGSYKIVYQAPTKSLCSERLRDWEAKFAPLDLKCAELTGDTDAAQLRNVQHATIIITTPEKWDSVTRKWKDHQKLMQMVKLFLIDEVHILKEDRGATLEAVVSRMKSVGSDVRFVALSATVPNSDDIATWLGKDPINTSIPASRERFGEEFRPVRLQRHVCGYQGNINDFAFDKALDAKLPEVIVKWSQRKPIMVFCFTRKSCVDTAKLLTNWWATKEPRERHWSAPRKRVVVADKDLRDTVSSGIAFHHAGLSAQDRTAIEKGYREGDISMICCTSTLAVGVNLPCHMVIIKNTVTYQNNAVGCKEYSDLEIMQMLGRAGRPQFDDSAVAVIMTRTHMVPHYEKMITGQEVLESRLHDNLIEHLNAEIGLGTVTGAASARNWLSGTFLYVRLKENPDHYKIPGDSPGRSLDERLEKICQKGIESLETYDLIRSTPKLRCTEFGDAMARYYLQLDTMKNFLDLAPKAKISEILSAVANAAEFKDVRLRPGEKNMYRSLNKNSSIKFPLPELSVSAHKVSLIIQAVLGAVDLPTEDQKQLWEFQSSKAAIFQHVQRLVRCIIDCQLYLEDAIATRNALMLARSLGAQVWDDSPLHMKQLEGVGIVSVRKLVAAGISTIGDLETVEPYRIEQALSRNPPYGMQVQDKAKAFPKLRISVKMMGEPIVKKGEHVTVKIKAEIGFLNEKLPESFHKRPVYVCLLAEISNGHKIHFARISAKKLNRGQDVLFSADLTSANQSIRAYVMCDEIAGTMRHVVLKPKISANDFSTIKAKEDPEQVNSGTTAVTKAPKRRIAQSDTQRGADNDNDNEFDDGGLDDDDLARAAVDDFIDIDELDNDVEFPGQPQKKKQKTTSTTAEPNDWEPKQLSNGKWACRHACGDKTSCKHLCCREGLDKKPKPPKQTESKKNADPGSDPKQTQLTMATTKKSNPPAPAKTTDEKPNPKSQKKTVHPKEARDLNRLHNSVTTTTKHVPKIGKGRMGNDGDRSTRTAGDLIPSFLKSNRDAAEAGTSDYGLGALDSNDLPEIDDIMGTQTASRVSRPRHSEDTSFDFDAFERMDENIGFTNAPDANSASNNAYDDELWRSKASQHGGRNSQYEDGTGSPSRPMIASGRGAHTTLGSTKERPLFIGHSTSEATSNEFETPPTESNSMQRAHHGSNEGQNKTFFSHPRQVRTEPTRKFAGPMVHPHSKSEDEQARSTGSGNMIGKDVDPIEEEAGSEDSVQKFVMGLLGTKDFNYID